MQTYFKLKHSEDHHWILEPTQRNSSPQKNLLINISFCPFHFCCFFLGDVFLYNLYSENKLAFWNHLCIWNIDYKLLFLYKSLSFVTTISVFQYLSFNSNTLSPSVWYKISYLFLVLLKCWHWILNVKQTMVMICKTDYPSSIALPPLHTSHCYSTIHLCPDHCNRGHRNRQGLYCILKKGSSWTSEKTHNVLQCQHKCPRSKCGN